MKEAGLIVLSWKAHSLFEPAPIVALLTPRP
jgi:hypothetical protein